MKTKRLSGFKIIFSLIQNHSIKVLLYQQKPLKSFIKIVVLIYKLKAKKL